jgi:hypothetical protein
MGVGNLQALPYPTLNLQDFVDLSGFCGFVGAPESWLTQLDASHHFLHQPV